MTENTPRNYDNLHEKMRLFNRMEIAFLHQLPVVRAGWGKHFTTDRMLGLWAPPDTPDNILEMIKRYGFDGGFSFPDHTDIRSPEMHRKNVTRMTALAQTALGIRGWKEVDLEVATVTDHPEIVFEVQAQLEKVGMNIHRVRFNGFACDGMGAAIIDTLANPQLQGRPTVVVAAENLSGRVVPRENIVLSTLFGNGGSAIAFVPGEEISLYDPSLVWAGVRKDGKKVITIPRAYDVTELAKKDAGIPTPSYYEVEEGAEFHYGQHFAANQMTTDGDTAAMQKETGAVFVEFLTPKIVEMIQRFQALFPEDKIDLALLHQPSEQILSGIAKRVKRHGFELPTPWLMRDTGFNNISSATIGVALFEAIQKGLIANGRPILLGTIGVGLSGHLAVVRFHPRDLGT